MIEDRPLRWREQIENDSELAALYAEMNDEQRFTFNLFGSVDKRRAWENEMFFGKRSPEASSVFFHLPQSGDVIRELGGEIK